jgi:energy-coupling factor transport system substrate-specific component
MNFQIAILAAVALVVGTGFAWYERSRPDSRMIALVAALAALAVAGRLVLTPIPNVVATTDVALISGYALGAAPGFAVGALAAPISNMWLGQGPWTVWQMAGWGLAGLLGAGLVRWGGRRFGRFGLATACGLMGFVYGALLDLSVMVSYGGEQSLDRYLALSARGIPFNVAHAAGNFAIALAAGPALVRMISRYRERLEFRWHPAGALPLVIALALIPSLLGSAVEAKAAAGAGSAVRWLKHAQGGDGGYAAGPGLPASTTMTGWSMLGLEAARANPYDVSKRGNSAAAYLRDHLSGVRSTGDIERTILAVVGAGANPRSFGGRDLVAELARARDRDGSFDGQVNLTAFGIMAMRAGGSGATGRSTKWLTRAQGSNGGWGYRPDVAGDADSTGAALQGLRAGGGSGAALAKGAAFLRRTQASDGGWTLSGAVTNSQSTAWAIQGLLAAGANPGSVAESGHTGFDFLRARQAADGHYEYSASSDQTPVWVTAQALLAAKRQILPIAPVARGPRNSKGGEHASHSSSPGVGGGSGGRSDGQGDPNSAPGSGTAANGPGASDSSGAPRGSGRHPGSKPGIPGDASAGDAGGPGASADPLISGPGVDAQGDLVDGPGSGATAGPGAADDSSGPGSGPLLGGLAAVIMLGGGWYWYRQRVG